MCRSPRSGVRNSRLLRSTLAPELFEYFFLGLSRRISRNVFESVLGFLRRIRFMIDFPRPDVDSREAIWRRCLPAGSPELIDSDFRQLARRIDLTGGHIRQITLRAAFIAAAAGEKIGLAHTAQAARAELTKLGMPPVEIDLTQGRRAA